MKNWFNINKVLIVGLLSAVTLPLYDLYQTGTVSLAIAVFTIITASLSFGAKNMRGQWQTIASTAGTVAVTIFTQYKTGEPIDVVQIILYTLIQLLGISAGPIKSRGYEHSEIIKEAKSEGEQITPTIVPPLPNK